MGVAEQKKEAPKCSDCRHTIQKRCRFGVELHCALHEDMMNVTHVVAQDGRTLFCPLVRQGEWK